jgi:hypothetical protein
LYGHIATTTGWTFSQIDQLTLWDVNDLFDYWQDNPPTHVLVAAYLMGGNKSRSSKRRRSGDTSHNFDELAQAVASAGGSVNKKLPGVYRQSTD